MSTQPLLSAENITVIREGRSILKNISLSIYPGECVGLVGANGSGKSTLIEVLSKISSPTEGNVTFDCKIGVTSSYSFMYKALTVKENLLLINEDLNSDLIASLKLDRVIDQRLSTLSRGELAKVSFVRALMGNPRVLFLDEISAPLDDDTLTVLLPKIKNYSNDNAVVFATHDLSRLRDIFTRIITISNGEISSNKSFVKEIWV